MNYNFPEQSLGSDFCQKSIKKIKELINRSTSFSVVGMPAMGISIFLRYLVTLKFAYFIHLDINELRSLKKEELFYKLLVELGGKGSESDFSANLELVKIILQELTLKNSRVVIVFNRFDRLKNEFNQNFFANLRALRDVDKEKVVMVFAANKPLVEQSPEGLIGGNLNMFSKTSYLPLFSERDLRRLVKLNTPRIKIPEGSSLINLSGGHYQLLQLLLKTDYSDNPLLDPAVNLQLKELYQSLNYAQKKQLQRLILGKKVKSFDRSLLDLGFIRDEKIFSALFSDFVRSNLRLKLPVKEWQLFKMLKARSEVVSKDEIFATIWKDEEGATDWALNSIIYRLRKNATFIASGYTIESYKKIGYQLLYPSSQ